MCRIDINMHFAGLKQPMPELIVHVDSLDIFPVSWCETNGYPLIYPIKPSGTQPKWFQSKRTLKARRASDDVTDTHASLSFS